MRQVITLTLAMALLLCALITAPRSAYADEASERILWKHQFNGQLWSSPVLADGVLYFGCDDKVFYAFDIEKQDTLWTFPTKNIIRSRADITDGIVTFASDDGNLYAVDQKTGAERWRFTLGGSRLARELPAMAPPYSFDYLSSSPTHHNGVIYIGSVNGQLFAIDHKTGQERWRFATTEMIRSTPLVYDDKVYFGGWDGFLRALDASTGDPVWSFDCGAPIQSSPAVGDGKIIIGSRSAQIFAVNALTGELEWGRPFEDGSWVESSPVVDGDAIYIGSSDHRAALALDVKTGALRWKFETGGWSWGAPTVAGGTVYIGGIAAHPYYFEGVTLKEGFYALDKATGDLQWSVTTGVIEGYITGGVFTRPMVADSVVYIGALDGCLYALKAVK